jgi:hypothetical protein
MSEMNKHSGNEVLLTADDVRQWQADLKKWEGTAAEADVQIKEIRRRLEAVALISGTPLLGTPLLDIASVSNSQADDNQESMGDAAKRLMAPFNRPIKHAELQAELRKIPRFQAMLEKNAGAYYYTMIQRLVTAGAVKKSGKKIRLVPKNETPPEGNPEGASKAVEG